MSLTQLCSSRYLSVLLVVLLVGLVTLFFYKLALTDFILARGDTFSYFYPYWDARNAAFRAGELPLWTPDIFMGAPLLANPQLGTYYPPNWLTTPFTAPDAIRWSVLGHVLWAALGTVLLYWRVVSRVWVPALTAGVLFAFGGYVGAHVEQINQLQGVAWLPWLLWLLHAALHQESSGRWWMLLAIAWALQLLSGHTQTVFMTGVALGMMVIAQPLIRRDEGDVQWRQAGIALLALLGVAVGAVLLAIPQVLPTLELTGMSMRGGGFNVQEATAFSLPPWYLGHALLPFTDSVLFTEYIGTLGIVGLGLAFVGAMTARDRSRWLWIALALIGIVFAFGRFNPLYTLLANLPGFNLFRVPARWLALWALGSAMLGGLGVQTLTAIADDTPMIRRLLLMGALLLALAGIAYGVASGGLIRAEDITGNPVPTRFTLALWGAGFIGLMLLVWLVKTKRLPPVVLLLAVIAELFVATRALPYNDLVPPDVYDGQRFTVSQLLAYGDDAHVEGQQPPPGRVLSISALQFDPGDRARLRERWESLGMSERAIQIAFTAMKQQEIVAPNLPLAWGIPSVDGYGGGVLPTIYYSQFMSLLLPDDTPRTVDGQIGQALARPACRGACIPETRWFQLTDTDYLITDKVYDVWHEGVYYDVHKTQVAYDDGGDPIYFSVPYDRTERDYEINAVSMLYEGDTVGQNAISTDDIQNLFPEATRQETDTLPDGLNVTTLYYDQPFIPDTLTHFPPDDDPSYRLWAMTLVDTRTGTFFPVTAINSNYGALQTRLSSDIKLYDAGGSRVYAPQTVYRTPDDWQGHEDALGILRENYTANNRVAVIHDDEATAESEPERFPRLFSNRFPITGYSATRVEIAIDDRPATWVILKDAYYPGWRATLNGEPVEIQRANVMFRAVQIPAGSHTLVFEFVPTLWYAALAAGALLWVLALAALGWLWQREDAAI